MGSLSEESSLDEDRRRGRRIQGMQERDIHFTRELRSLGERSVGVATKECPFPA